MFAPGRGRALERAIASAPSAAAAAAPLLTLPGFLVPAFHHHNSTTTAPASSQVRQFSASTGRPSKLGRIPLSIPPGVELLIGESRIKKDPTTYLQIPRRTVTVTGPLGKLDLDVPPFIQMNHDTSTRKLSLSVLDQNIKQQKEMWGTIWRYLDRYIIGVSEGHTAVLRLVGIGYRAWLEDAPKPAYAGQKAVMLKLGFTHVIDMPVPAGVSASIPQPTRILLEGINREEVMSFAARIRRWRVPEPYKGKGIFVNDETIKLKQKKIS